MPGAREIVVKIIGDNSSLNRALSESESKLSGWGKTAAIAGGSFAAGIVASQTIDFLQDATKEAEQDAQSQRLLATQIRDVTSATDQQIAGVESYIDKLSRQTGVMDDQLRPAYAGLVRATGDIGEAQTELNLAMDISSARGIDLQTVVVALEKAHEGNIGALGRLGISYKDLNGNALTLQETLSNASQTYAGAAEAAITPSQKWAVATHELKEQIGTVLLPVLNNLATFMADTLLPAIQNAIVWWQEHWPAIEEAVVHTWNVVHPIISTMVDFIQTQFEVVKTVVQVIVDLLHGDWGKAWDDFGAGVAAVWGNIVSIIKRTVGQIIDAVGGLISDLVKKIADLPGQLVDALPGPLKTAAKALGWATGVSPITSALGGLFTADGGIFDKPTLRIIGEAGPEAVIPLSKMGSMAGGSSGTSVYIANVQVTDVRGFLDVLQQIDRTYGGVPINVRTPA